MKKTVNPSIERYVHSEEEQQKLYKRTLWVVILSQTFGGAGLAAGITVGALIARQMLGSESFTGLPTALFTLGSALSAFLVGRFSQRFGRRYGLSFGFITGGVGAVGVIAATAMENIALLFLALFIYGAGTSTNLQARYAGTDLAKPKQRATAISMAMVATTIGAVAGPNLVTPTGHLAEAIGLPTLTGPFLLAALAYLLAGFTFFFLLKPDPLLVAVAIAEKQNEEQVSTGGINQQSTVDRLGVGVGAIVLVMSHVVMVAIMTMTPIHMEHAGSGLSLIGLVISMHVAAMYLPSLVTGILVDKVGRSWMVVASGVTLSFAGFIAAYSPGDRMWSVALALILLGLGWNFGLISGTAMIIDATTIQNRAKIQGSVDVSVALAGSAGGLLSGIIVANSSYAFLSFIGAYMAILFIPLMIWVRYRKK
ncbi:MFS transporter [Solibacillus merdavium]|uniref:MFS transporter n=1 Tax=Solibacillus merdavium TaxID=2762218 RepID=A0ABR8XMP4_9BACL|nr:MFS transporter [Solibacillus merdavium]MBD8033208.1 MFS transporter [Solibacillus merdavium]